MEGYIKSFDNEEIYFYEWDEVKNPIGVVQIFHGMSEHAKRYEPLARFLNEQGFIVCADDHRAHGKTAREVENVGKYDKGNLFEDTLQDEIFISKMMVQKYHLPLYIFSHSYGSFLCQAYIERCDYYKKAILCGSALMKGRFNVKLGLMVAKMTAKFKGPNAPAKFITKVNFDGYNKKFKGGSWLNTIQEEVTKYKSDPFCSQTFSAKFYIDFFSSFKKTYSKEAVSAIDKSKPLYIIAGEQDAVSNMSKLAIKLYNFYKKLGVQDVKLTIYEGARHEIHNDKCRDKVYQDILQFLKE